MKRNIRNVFRLKETKGQIGVEVEFELASPDYPQVNGWGCVADGSLRGNGIEYNFDKPVGVKKSHTLVKNLYQAILQSTRIVDSPRAGVHVHINVQDMTEDEVMKLILLYIVVENVLVHWCGETREGNMFCLRSKDAEGLVQCLLKVIEYKSFSYRSERSVRYASINIEALPKFGSLEFRALQTPLECDRIIKWIDILMCLKDAVSLFPNPVDIVESMSNDGVDTFLKGIFGEFYNELIYEGADIDMYEGIRLVQPIVYEEWDFNEDVIPNPTPTRPRSIHEYLSNNIIDEAISINSNVNETTNITFLEGYEDV